MKRGRFQVQSQSVLMAVILYACMMRPRPRDTTCLTLWESSLWGCSHHTIKSRFGLHMYVIPTLDYIGGSHVSEIRDHVYACQLIQIKDKDNIITDTTVRCPPERKLCFATNGIFDVYSGGVMMKFVPYIRKLLKAGNLCIFYESTRTRMSSTPVALTGRYAYQRLIGTRIWINYPSQHSGELCGGCSLDMEKWPRKWRCQAPKQKSLKCLIISYGGDAGLELTGWTNINNEWDDQCYNHVSMHYYCVC